MREAMMATTSARNASEARRHTMSWSCDAEEAGDVAKQPRDHRSKDDTESERRRKKTVDDMQALVGEAEGVEERVRTRSRRMRGPSASPDQPPVTEPVPSEERTRTSDRASEPADDRTSDRNMNIHATMGPPSREPSPESSPASGQTLPSMPAADARESRKGDSGRYSFVYPANKPKKKP
jgi:hypothetical protein